MGSYIYKTWQKLLTKKSLHAIYTVYLYRFIFYYCIVYFLYDTIVLNNFFYSICYAVFTFFFCTVHLLS